MKEVSLVLNAADIQQLGAFLNKAPYEFAAPIVNFLNQKIAEQQPKVSTDTAPAQVTSA